MSTSACLRDRAAKSPPKPDPTITTRCRLVAVWVGTVCGTALTYPATEGAYRSFRARMRPPSPSRSPLLASVSAVLAADPVVIGVQPVDVGADDLHRTPHVCGSVAAAAGAVDVWRDR